jgi:hypothetical protein
MFAEAKFEYTGSPVKRALLNFNQSTEELRFAFDNLLFAVVPEPTTAVLATPLFVLTMVRRCARSGTSSRNPRGARPCHDAASAACSA